MRRPKDFDITELAGRDVVFGSDEGQCHDVGDGWTVGAYLGWKIISTIRYDVANFNFEPSAKVYAL
ncbi:hypothetical protein G8O24_08185 [Bradyrhizobium sp. INPA01-394B]|uniref:Uncharacterized protein n=1 Tax=Bradyrhizobium campsiandrae TaxID=1729892 RepID=A0ABR7TXD9_9BRAD|nr:hypothetical protein [Bradyrhizobium campsiandrae]MBC9877324.1 hypothetical protein [Bradyrhizobium campsiandrae]MBC9976614.1 hypothetical protein [Bradyrhizobium campsiandrae]